MTFVELNIIFLSIAVLVFAVGLWRSTQRRTAVSAVVLAMVAMVVLTAIFDNVMIASGLFDYAGHTLNGLHVGLAPIEDFAYPVAAVLLLSGLWLTLTGGKRP